MSSNKAKKGNPFERDVAYSLIQAGFDVEILGDNSKSIDIIAQSKASRYAIECKFHRSFTWNKAVKYFKKIPKKSGLQMQEPLLIFKSNRQPVLVMHQKGNGISVTTFDGFFHGFKFSRRPKGWKIWNYQKKDD